MENKTIKVDLSLVDYKRKDGTQGQKMVIKTPKGVSMTIKDFFGNPKLECLIKHEIKGDSK